MEYKTFSDDEFSDLQSIMTEQNNDKRGSKIEIVLDLSNYRDDSTKYICMTVFGVFSAYAIATTTMNLYGQR